MKLPDCIKSALIDELEIIHSKLDGTDRASDIEALIRVIHEPLCKSVWVNSEKLTNANAVPVDGQVFLAQAIMLALNYKRKDADEWDRNVINHSQKLTELLHTPLDESLKTECESAIEKLEPILEPMIEKIKNRHHGKNEAFWDKRRQGKDVARRYFVQHLGFAYFRRDKGDKHCSEVTKVTIATELFETIDERVVRRILEDINDIESDHTANLSLAYAITPEVDTNNK